MQVREMLDDKTWQAKTNINAILSNNQDDLLKAKLALLENNSVRKLPVNVADSLDIWQVCDFITAIYITIHGCNKEYLRFITESLNFTVALLKKPEFRSNKLFILAYYGLFISQELKGKELENGLALLKPKMDEMLLALDSLQEALLKNKNSKYYQNIQEMYQKLYSQISLQFAQEVFSLYQKERKQTKEEQISKH